MTHFRRIIIALLFLTAGCGKGGPQIAPVHGSVALNGQPLANADIRFQPNGTERPSTGRTDSEGRYQLMFKRGESGAVVGQHTVHIWVSPEVVPNPPQIATRPEIRRDVKSGDNEFDFDVTTEKDAAKK